MKLATFQAAGEDRVGVVGGEEIVDVAKAVALLERRADAFARQPELQAAAKTVLAAGAAPRDMIELLERGEGWRNALDRVLGAPAHDRSSTPDISELVTPLASARLRAPIPRPGKITAVGLNYASHAREQGKEPPPRPVFFVKTNNTIGGPGEPIVLPPSSAQVDYEAEFAVVIGKAGRQIPEERAFEHVAGYMILNDVTARDFQAADQQWFRGKSCDTFGPTGPWIVTREEIPDPHALRISLTLNDKTMQDASTSDLIFKIPFLVSYLSQSLTWEVGDILSTGTPAGVGYYRKPQVFLKPGDIVRITVERIGTLTNPIQ